MFRLAGDCDASNFCGGLDRHKSPSPHVTIAQPLVDFVFNLFVEFLVSAGHGIATHGNVILFSVNVDLDV